MARQVIEVGHDQRIIIVRRRIGVLLGLVSDEDSTGIFLTPEQAQALAQALVEGSAGGE
jgi:hypothetical protein